MLCVPGPDPRCQGGHFPPAPRSEPLPASVSSAPRGSAASVPSPPGAQWGFTHKSGVPPRPLPAWTCPRCTRTHSTDWTSLHAGCCLSTTDTAANATALGHQQDKKRVSPPRLRHKLPQNLATETGKQVLSPRFWGQESGPGDWGALARGCSRDAGPGSAGRGLSPVPQCVGWPLVLRPTGVSPGLPHVMGSNSRRRKK